MEKEFTGWSHTRGQVATGLRRALRFPLHRCSSGARVLNGKRTFYCSSSALTLGGRDVVTITHKGGDRQNWAGRGLVRRG